MANNPYVSKVVYGATVLVDLTGDTVTSGSLLSGYSAHDKSGAAVSGSIATKSSTDVTVSGNTVTIPVGYYSSAVSKSIDSTSIVQGNTTISGTIATFGTATWDAGYIVSGSILAASFSNTASSNTEYLDISGTTSAPVLTSGGYLYINKGIITDNMKISTAKLVPDGASANLSSSVILSGYSAYDNDGTLVAGNIPTKTSSDISVSGKTLTIPVGYYASEITINVSEGSVTQNAPTINTSTGLVTATSTVVAGYVGASTESNTLQLSTQSADTITPTRSEQTAVAAGKYTLGAIKVAAIPNNYYLLSEVYPVGSLWATEDSTANPATVLGFGTWIKVAPANATWGALKNSTWNIQTSSVDGIYVYKRTA